MCIYERVKARGAIRTGSDVSGVNLNVQVAVVTGHFEVEAQHRHDHHGGMLSMLAAAQQLNAAKVL